MRHGKENEPPPLQDLEGLQHTTIQKLIFSFKNKTRLHKEKKEGEDKRGRMEKGGGSKT